MEENRIYLDIPENNSVAAGPGPGKICYKMNRGRIDDEAVNVLVFPPHVKRVVGSFFTGFFEELRKKKTPGDIKKLFVFDPEMPCYESAQEAFRIYLSND